MGPIKFFEVYLSGFGLGVCAYWRRERPRVWLQAGPVSVVIDFGAFAPGPWKV